MSKLDAFLAFGESFDWLTPLVDLTKDMNNPDAQEIVVSRFISVNAAKRKLKSYGIKPWGVKYNENSFLFIVKASDMEQAKKILGEYLV